MSRLQTGTFEVLPNLTFHYHINRDTKFKHNTLARGQEEATKYIKHLLSGNNFELTHLHRFRYY